MIPRKIHQIWFSTDSGPHPGSPETWRDMNPGWDYKLWNAGQLLDLVDRHFPAFSDLYRAYPNFAQRTDLARYMLLWLEGGLYADTDTACLAPLEPITADNRVILSEEPPTHWVGGGGPGLDKLLCSAVMASPARHDLWLHVLRNVHRMRHAMNNDVLDSTGPRMMTGSCLSFGAPERLCINSCHLFTPFDKNGTDMPGPAHGDYAGLRLSNHLWNGSWFGETRSTRWHAAKGLFRKWRAGLSGSRSMTLAEASTGIDLSALSGPLPDASAGQPPMVTIFTPVRDGAPFIERHFQLISALDHPRDRLRIVWCEGGSRDDSRARLARLREEKAAQFAGIDIIDFDSGLRLPRRNRWKPKYQLRRRAALARVRNTMVDRGLRTGDDWVLWIDVDICDFALDVLKRLLAARARIVTPDCVVERDGPSYDRNAFVEIGVPRDSDFYKHVTGGLHQPPDNWTGRKVLHDFRYLDRVPLSAVGGTMLLVDANLFRAGLRFPERPYRFLVETEGFGMLARDLGVVPVGLPGVTVRHVDS